MSFSKWLIATSLLVAVCYSPLGECLPTTVSPSSGASTSPIVRTSTFAVQGTILAVNQSSVPRPTNITSVEAFFGVPFAEPPVGPLRFELPVPIRPYTKVANCSTYANMPVCHNQLNPPASSGVPISEDCLRLSIYRPKGTTNKSKLPVLVFIHGGAYISGGALTDMGAPGGTNPAAPFPNFYASQGVVAIQMQYRLAILGFGADGTNQMPGSNGLYDQKLALKWIHDNIDEFGGDPDKVTVWGISAGASSVAYLSVNPESNRYFQRAIEMSGSFNTPWGEPANMTVESTFNIAAQVGCKVPSKLKSCLKAVNMSAIAAAQLAYSYLKPDFAFASFMPSLNSGFTAGSFASAVAAAPKKITTLVGFNTDESLFQTMMIAGMNPNPNNFTTSDMAALIKQLVLPSSTSNQKAVAQIDALRQDIINFYTNVNNQANASDPVFPFIQYTRFVSDVSFIIPGLWEARLKAQNGWPVYLYNVDFYGDYTGPSAARPYLAEGHTADYPYTLGRVYLFPLDMGPNDYAMQKLMVNMYLDFAKGKGKPSVPSVSSWPKLDFSGSKCNQAMQKYNALNVNPTNPRMERGANAPATVAERLAFWDEMSAKYDLALVHSFINTQGQCVPSKQKGGQNGHSSSCSSDNDSSSSHHH